MKRLLCIDGGGIRGIIPARVLVSLEHKLQSFSGDPDLRISDCFDLIAGTSTGAILSCLLLCPDAEGRPKFTATQALQLYLKHGTAIFDTSFPGSLFKFRTLFRYKYSERNLESVLKHYFKDTLLSELLKPCLIPVYEIEERRSFFFASHDVLKKGDAADFLVRHVCRAASAAPTFFKPAMISSMSDVSYPFIDGGVFANNPSLCAYSETRNACDHPDASNILLFSLGTGGEDESYTYKRARRWGAAAWIRPAIDIMMSAVSETTDYHLNRIFSAGGNSENYIRIQPEHLRRAKPAIDQASVENLVALLEVGTKTAEDYDEVLTRVARRVLADNDMIKF